MTILVTGASGFIGGRLLGRLAQATDAPLVLAMSSRPVADCRTVRYTPDRFEIADGEGLLDDVQTIVHAGAFTPKSGAEANDIARSGSNIRFTEHLLDRPWPSLRRIVYLSTLDVYAQAARLDEASPTIPDTLYGWSKLYGEQMVAAFGKQRGLSSTVLRIGHVYGPGEEQYAKFLPRAIRSVLTGEAVELWGSGEDLRSLIYVDDVIHAIAASLDRPAMPDVVNVAGARARSLNEILASLALALGRDFEIRRRPGSAPRRDFVFDTNRLQTHLLPTETDFVEGLAAELAHMRKILAP